MISKKIAVGAVVALLLAYYFSGRLLFSKKNGKTVKTRTGSVRGIISLSRDGREFYEWLGLPYAKPPVGSLRFATPQPLDYKWEGVRDGSFYRDACAQMEALGGSILGKEDCLFLNVYVPVVPGRDQKLLPVLFYIHGGYFAFGAANHYKPDYFMDQDVVLVTIQYRLAALGFLNTGDAQVRGNMGLKDQSMALKWVKENIAYFGGGPDQVTIFGESAGGSSVHFHMMSPMSHGLFERAISQSGSALNAWAFYEDPAGQSKRFAGKFNCTVKSTAEMVKCLRDVEVTDLLLAHREYFELRRSKEMVFVPTVEAIIDEETFLPDHPINLINSGNVSRIPWLTGLNADEGLAIIPNVILKEDFRKECQADWTFVADFFLLSEDEKKLYPKIIDFYFGSDKNGENLDVLKDFEAMTKLATDRYFAYGIQKAAISHAEHSPVYFYLYNKTGPSLFDFMLMFKGNYPPIVEVLIGLASRWFQSTILGQTPKCYGVCHGDEIAMLFYEGFGIFKVPRSDPNYEFSKDMVQAWVSFASLPTVESTKFRDVSFPRLNTKDKFKVLEINDVPKVEKFRFEERMQFWKSIDKQLTSA